MHRHIRGRHFVRRLIEDEISGAIHDRRRPSTGADRAPEDRLHASDELLRPERLRDVVVRAELETTEDVALVLTCREKQNRDVLVDVTDPLEDDEAGELRQIDVEDHEIGVFAADGLDRGLAVVSPYDVISLAT